MLSEFVILVMFSPLTSNSQWGSPPHLKLSTSAISLIVLLGSMSTMVGGKYPKSPAPTYLLFLGAISHGAHLNEGNAIRIKIIAGVIVQINSIIVDIEYGLYLQPDLR